MLPSLKFSEIFWKCCPAFAAESTVLGSWSCAILTSSFAKEKRTSGVKTHVCGWYFGYTSTSPMAGPFLCRPLPIPSNAVSRQRNKLSTCAKRLLPMLHWATILLTFKTAATSAPNKLYTLFKAIAALYMNPNLWYLCFFLLKEGTMSFVTLFKCKYKWQTENLTG